MVITVAVISSGILKAKQKLGITFNSDKLDGIDFTKLQNIKICGVRPYQVHFLEIGIPKKRCFSNFWIKLYIREF